ncbi:MAG TPA: DUF4124 domain-containing protein [Halothiobacillus sp.]|nr:DUF4124 domain-containing protein [Halothiobacillus sp.]
MQRLGKTALIALVTVSTLTIAGLSLADGPTRIYKWVDKKGETHFSQLPPPNGQAQQINPDYAAPVVKPEGNASDEQAEKSPDQKKSTLPADATITAVNKKEAEKACTAAEAQIKTLQNSENQLMTQDKDGKFRALTPAEIAGRLKQAQDVANKACVK